MTVPRSTPRPAANTEQLAHYRDGIARYLRYLGARPDSVDDLVQDTFVQACAGPFEWRSEAATRAWLRTIARNTLTMAARRRSLPITEAAVDELAATWDRHCGDDDGDALFDALRSCLQLLRERHRRALAWRYGEDQSVSAVGERLGIGTAGADSLLTRVRAALRRCIEGRRNR